MPCSKWRLYELCTKRGILSRAESALFAAPELAFHGLTDEVGALLSVSQHGINARQRARTEAAWRLLIVDLRSAHREAGIRYHFCCQGLRFDDITYRSS